MNTSAANTSTGSPPLKPATGRVSRVPSSVLERALRPQPSPLVVVVRAANEVRELTEIGRAAVRATAAKDAPLTRFKRSASANRQWELTQRVYRFQGRRVA